MSYEVTGILKHIGQPVQNGQYTNQSILVETQEQYPQNIELGLGKALIGTQLPQQGSMVTVKFNLRGTIKRDNPNSAWVNLQAWAITSPAAQNQPAQQQQTGYGNGGNQQSFGGYNNAPQQQQNVPQNTSGTDDLPF